MGAEWQIIRRFANLGIGLWVLMGIDDQVIFIFEYTYLHMTYDICICNIYITMNGEWKKKRMEDGFLTWPEWTLFPNEQDEWYHFVGVSEWKLISLSDSSLGKTFGEGFLQEILQVVVGMKDTWKDK